MGVKKEWEAHGFKCRVLDSPFGGLNGYVAVPPGHPVHGMSYWDFDLDVHGGVTYAEFGDDKIHKESGEVLWPDPTLYWLGFDTAHSGDWVSYAPERGGRRWGVNDVIQEVEKMALQLRQMANGETTKREISDEEAIALLKTLRQSIRNLGGVKIPFNIIKNLIQPLSKWLNTYLDPKGDKEVE